MAGGDRRLRPHQALGCRGDVEARPWTVTRERAQAVPRRAWPLARRPCGRSSAATDSLYGGKKALLVPIHKRLLETLSTLGADIEQTPKQGYISLRRRKQFAMIKPGAKEVNVGLILGDVPPGPRLQSAATFNALFSHRVRVRAPEEVDAELTRWLRLAYARAA